MGLSIAAGSIGAFVSFLPGSYIADIFGRKICVGLGAMFILVATAIQVSIPNYWAFFATRVFAGIGIGISSTAAPLLVTEIAHPDFRQSATALYNSTWCIGSSISAAATLISLRMSSSWAWKFPCLLQAIFPILQLTSLIFVPESPRWLVATNRKTEALDVLAHFRAKGDVEDDLVQHEFDEICQSIKSEVEEKGTGWQTFVSSRGHLQQLTICILCGIMQEWAGNGKPQGHLKRSSEYLCANALKE